MIRQSQVVVGAQIDDVMVARAYDPALRAAEHTLVFVKTVCLEILEISA